MLNFDDHAIANMDTSESKINWKAIQIKADDAEEYEHSLGFWQAAKIYKKVRLASVHIFSGMSIIICRQHA